MLMMLLHYRSVMCQNVDKQKPFLNALSSYARMRDMNTQNTAHTHQGTTDVSGLSSEDDGSQPHLVSYGWQPVQFDSIGDKGSASSSRMNACQHREVREYSTGEEIANSITHGIGVALAIIAIPVTVVLAVKHGGGGVALAAALIYSISMLLEYTASTMYHALTNRSAKKVFKVIDHASIYLFIAGSYTPYCLLTLGNSQGICLCAGVWILALVGVAIEAFWVFRPRWVSAVIYLLLGWCVILYLPPLIANLALPGLILLAVGGVCYSIGCVFYVLKKIPYMHSVFHLWVLAGSILQFLSIVFYVF